MKADSNFDRGFRAATKQAVKTVEAFIENYPIDVWPDIKPEEERLPDRVAAMMARHICKVLQRKIASQGPE